MGRHTHHAHLDNWLKVKLSFIMNKSKFNSFKVRINAAKTLEMMEIK